MREQFKAFVSENDTEARPAEIEAAEITEPESVPDNAWLIALEQYILQHLSDPTFSVASAAEAFEMSRFKFTRAVSLAVGMTALDYIQEIRLNEARRLLHTDPNLPIKQVAAVVGFANPKLFSRKFQQRFGVYPSQI
jgi:AraC-like DNA-binding protein